jgi:hypothetical protein
MFSCIDEIPSASASDTPHETRRNARSANNIHLSYRYVARHKELSDSLTPWSSTNWVSRAGSKTQWL